MSWLLWFYVKPRNLPLIVALPPSSLSFCDTSSELRVGGRHSRGEMKSLALKPFQFSDGDKQILILSKMCAGAELDKLWGRPQALGGPGVPIFLFSWVLPRGMEPSQYFLKGATQLVLGVFREGSYIWTGCWKTRRWWCRKGTPFIHIFCP